MNGAHLHLLLNHFPMIGLVFSILILGLGLIRKSDEVIRSGLLIAFISGALAIPTFLTGEPAEKIIEHSPGFSETLLEAHEEAAEFAVWVMGMTAIAAVAGLFYSVKKNRIPRLLMSSIVSLNIFSLVVIGRTNNLGGKISHPEIRDSRDQAPPVDANK